MGRKARLSATRPSYANTYKVRQRCPVGPHVMIALPDLVHADGIQRAEHADGPFVAYGDTPYELVIMPVAAAGDTLQLANGE